MNIDSSAGNERGHRTLFIFFNLKCPRADEFMPKAIFYFEQAIKSLTFVMRNPFLSL